MKYKTNLIAGQPSGGSSGVVGMLSLAMLLPLMLPMSQVSASQEDYIELRLEEPAQGAVATGVSNLRGWAVGKFGVEKVELLIDGVYRYDLPYGGKRGDIGSKFNYPDDEASGFSMAYNFSLLPPGEHSITIRAWDRYDDFNEVTNTFQVVRFGEGEFVRGSDALDLSLASAAIDGSVVRVYNGLLNELPYNITLRWNTQSQKPEIIALEPFDLSRMLDVDGEWDVVLVTDKTACNGTSTSGSFSIGLSSDEYLLDLNGLEMSFAGVNPDSLGVKFSATEARSDGNISWLVEIDGDQLSGSGIQPQAGCNNTYQLTGSKQ